MAIHFAVIPSSGTRVFRLEGVFFIPDPWSAPLGLTPVDLVCCQEFPGLQTPEDIR
jgi:hypothetical protein